MQLLFFIASGVPSFEGAQNIHLHRQPWDCDLDCVRKTLAGLKLAVVLDEKNCV